MEIEITYKFYNSICFQFQENKSVNNIKSKCIYMTVMFRNIMSWKHWLPLSFIGFNKSTWWRRNHRNGRFFDFNCMFNRRNYGPLCMEGSAHFWRHVEPYTDHQRVFGGNGEPPIKPPFWPQNPPWAPLNISGVSLRRMFPLLPVGGHYCGLFCRTFVRFDFYSTCEAKNWRPAGCSCSSCRLR